VAQTRSRSTARSTNARTQGRFRRFRNAVVQAGREPRETSRRVLDGATRQLVRASDGLDQAAQITRRAGDALEDLSASLLRLSQQLRSSNGYTGRRTGARPDETSDTIGRRKLHASRTSRGARKRTTTRRTTKSGRTGSGDELRVAGVGA
jgi:hypothetical protein